MLCAFTLASLCPAPSHAFTRPAALSPPLPSAAAASFAPPPLRPRRHAIVRATDAAAYRRAVELSSRSGEWREALRLLDEMEALPQQSAAPAARRDGTPRATPTTRAYSMVMGACGRAGQWRVAVALLHRMRRRRVPYDTGALNAAIGACARSGKMDVAVRMLTAARKADPQLQADTVTFTTLMDGYSRHGEAAKALQLFDSLPRLRVRRDAVCYQSAIAACSRAGEWQQAVALLQRMEADGFAPTAKAACSAMACCTNGGHPQLALEIFEGWEARGVADGALFSNAITAHARASDAMGALRRFRAMKLAGVPRDAIAFNAAMHAVGGLQRRRTRQTLRLWRLMQAEQVDASDVTYSVLLQVLWNQPEAVVILDEAMRRSGTFSRCLQKSRAGWVLDLHGLSAGAARAMVLWLLSHLVKIKLDGQPLPAEVRLITGWGKHTPRWRKSQIGGGESSLKSAVLALLAAFRVPIEPPAAPTDGVSTMKDGTNHGEISVKMGLLGAWIDGAINVGIVRGCYERGDLFVISLNDRIGTLHPVDR
ncbi:hypothetical protein AB1Y20_014262 [Prymnesium parvum]|uniref:Smr domain-containing protein n=1 Tax=Prymnesium parvum TaxID=97485 RepID=A0AB34IFP3_PRYPA